MEPAAEILALLKARNKREYNRLQRDERRAKSELKQQQYTIEVLQSRCADLENRKAAPANPEQLRSLQDELTASSRHNAEFAKQVLELNDQLRRAQEGFQTKSIEAAEMKTILQKTQIKLQKLTEDKSEQDSVLVRAKAELTQLQIHLVKMESELEKLTVENKSLLDRWMKKVEEDVGKLNEANRFFNEVQGRPSAVPTSSGGSGTTGDDLAVEDFVMTEAAGVDLMGLGIVTSLPSDAKRTIQVTSSELNGLDFSPSGNLIVTAGADKQLRLYDAHTGTQRNRLVGAERAVLSVAFSPDERMVLAASGDNAARVWSLELGRIQHSLLGHMTKVLTGKFTFDSTKAITGSHDRSLKVWDLQHGYNLRTIFCYSSCNDLSISRDGMMVVSGHLDNHVRFWDTRNGDMAHELSNLHTAQVTSLTTTPDGNCILSNSRDNLLKLVDLRTYQVVQTFKDDNYRNGLNWARATISPDGRYVAAGSIDGTIVIWNAATGSTERILKKPHKTTVTCASWSAQGYLASVDRSGMLVQW